MTNRGLHRDVAYFYVGLIIAFAFSGIILNHRQDWYPMDYTYEHQEVSLEIADPENIEETEIQGWVTANNWEVEYDSHRIRDNSLRVYFKGNAILDLDLTTGKGLLEFKKKVPLLGHTMYLHKTTNKFWIWYSDIFGAAMILIAVTGILIPVGKNGFKSRGWKFAIAGLLFPILTLVIFT